MQTPSPLCISPTWRKKAGADDSSNFWRLETTKKYIIETTGTGVAIFDSTTTAGRIFSS